MSESKVVIPEAAVEAAEVAVKEAMHEYGPDGHDDGFQEITRAALEAAAPHLLAGIVAKLYEGVTALENTLVDECDYPALCAQREAMIGAIQMLQEATK